MNIPKAIEILKPKMIRANQAEDFEYGDAIKLGIEALKAINQVRAGFLRAVHIKLPGETKD